MADFVLFPKYKYHATLDPVVVQSSDEEAELGDGWFDSPAAAVAVPTRKGKN